MNLNYNILFNIELFHEYYLSRNCNDFSIVPTADCMLLARSLNIQWRKKSNGLLACIMQNELNEPYINIPPEKQFRRYYEKAVFRFYLKLDNPYFVNYTNTSSGYDSSKKFYFSNLSNNESLYLTVPVPDYANGKVYLPGSLVRDATTGTVYEALKKHTPRKKAQLHDTLLWVPKSLLHSANTIDDFEPGKRYSPGQLVKDPADGQVFEALARHIAGSADELANTILWFPRGAGQLQYPTENDLVEHTNGNYVCKLSTPVSKAEVAVFGFNFNSENPGYDVPVFKDSMRFETPVTKVPILMGTFAPGRYEVHVNKEVRAVYVDPLLNDVNAYAIIEIFNHLPGSNPYSLLTDDEKIKQTRYQVHFANRRVLWKYIRKDGRADRITDTAENGYEFHLHGNDFVSATPIPLTENALKTLKLEFSTKDFRLFPLPNPSINRLARYNQDEYDYLCSEVLLNY